MNDFLVSVNLSDLFVSPRALEFRLIWVYTLFKFCIASINFLNSFLNITNNTKVLIVKVRE